jgi:lysophospholipase L1-like esterase
MKTFNLALILILVSAACSGVEAQPRPGVRVVVLGSSTAQGAGPSDVNLSWVQRFREHCAEVVEGCQVINLARGGYATPNVLPTDHAPRDGRSRPDAGRNISEALRLQPDAIIINLPSNDAAYGIPVEEQLANYELIMERAREASVPVWITTTQPRNMSAEQREALLVMRDSTHSRWPEQTIDFWTGLATDDGHVVPAMDSGDGIHLNAAAHRIMFERVREHGIPMKALRTVKR